MKTVRVPKQSRSINALLKEAQDEDVLVCAADGSEFLLTPVDDFELEVARTRQNKKLMAFLEERARQTETIPLHEVRRMLNQDRKRSDGTRQKSSKR